MSISTELQPTLSCSEPETSDVLCLKHSQRNVAFKQRVWVQKEGRFSESDRNRASWHPLGAEDAVGRWGSAMQGGKAPRVPAMAAATFGAMTAPTPQLKAAASLPNPVPESLPHPQPRRQHCAVPARREDERALLLTHSTQLIGVTTFGA